MYHLIHRCLVNALVSDSTLAQAVESEFNEIDLIIRR
jgi:hypothetical protein